MKIQNSIFPPVSIMDEVQEKGFSVYPYISLKELSMTIQKDFLNILDKIKYLFLVILGLGYLVGQETGFITVLVAGYLSIFTYLVIRVFLRTRAFVYLSNVIFTPKNLITGYHVHTYKTPRLNQSLSEHAELFDEYLGTKSQLSIKIENKRNEILKSSGEDLKKVNNHIDLRNGDHSKAALYFYLLITAYSLSLILFYYIGILFVFGFFLVYSLVIKAYLLIFEQRELRVKNQTEAIEAKLQELQRIETEAKAKIKSFKDGQIFDLDKYVTQNFGSFYETIESIVAKQKSLRTYIDKQFKKNIIDFDQFETYIWKKIKVPAQQMESLLNNVLKNTTQQITTTKSTIKKTTDKHLLGPLEQKLQNLERIQHTTKAQLTKISELGNA